MIRHLRTWRAAALATALAGVIIGPQLPRELVILLRAEAPRPPTVKYRARPAAPQKSPLVNCSM